MKDEHETEEGMACREDLEINCQTEVRSIVIGRSAGSEGSSGSVGV